MNKPKIIFAFKKAALYIACVFSFLAGNSLMADAWKPPVGIPAPEFGITQTHLMYAGQTFDYSTGSAPYKDAGNGPYSHYVDNSKSNATDSDNPYGTASLPRQTIPKDIPAGSVVEIHGGPYSTITFNGNSIGLYGVGTAAKPIFIRGVPGALPTFSLSCIVFGSYIIYENLSFIKNANISHRPELFPGGERDSDHLVFRHLVMKGTGVSLGNGAAIGGIGSWDTTDAPWSRNIVVWDCSINDYGDWSQSADENDYQGIQCGGFNATDIWFLNNTVYHMGGDGCRIGSNPVPSYPTYTSKRLYVGANKFYDNHENGLDIKGCYDAVISQNEMWGASPTSSSNGEEIVAHYKCDNIWIVNNTLHNATSGISVSDGLNLYFIGNAVYDCEIGVKFWSSNFMPIIGNTFARFQTGISDVGGSYPHHVINNIFTGLTDKTTGFHVKLATASAVGSDMKNNVVYESGGTFRVYWGVLYTSLASLKVGTGKAQDCLVSDPKFINGTANDFHLQSASSAKDAAATPATYTALFATRFPGSSIAYDPDGISRPQGSAWDIGAYEYVSGDPTPTPTPTPAAPENLQIVPH